MVEIRCTRRKSGRHISIVFIVGVNERCAAPLFDLFACIETVQLWHLGYQERQRLAAPQQPVSPTAIETIPTTRI
jgi:hypothetical protein